MTFEPNITPINPVPVTERLNAQRSEPVRESNAQEDPTRVQISDVAKDFSKAVQQLKAEEALRPDEVERGRSILKNWSSLSDEQVDVILNKVGEEA